MCRTSGCTRPESRSCGDPILASRHDGVVQGRTGVSVSRMPASHAAATSSPTRTHRTRRERSDGSGRRRQCPATTLHRQPCRRGTMQIGAVLVMRERAGHGRYGFRRTTDCIVNRLERRPVPRMPREPGKHSCLQDRLRRTGSRAAGRTISPRAGIPSWTRRRYRTADRDRVSASTSSITRRTSRCNRPSLATRS